MRFTKCAAIVVNESGTLNAAAIKWLRFYCPIKIGAFLLLPNTMILALGEAASSYCALICSYCNNLSESDAVRMRW